MYKIIDWSLFIKLYAIKVCIGWKEMETERETALALLHYRATVRRTMSFCLYLASSHANLHC